MVVMAKTKYSIDLLLWQEYIVMRIGMLEKSQKQRHHQCVVVTVVS